MVALGVMSSAPGVSRKCASAARDLPEAGGPQMRIESGAGEEAKCQNSYLPVEFAGPAPLNWGARSFIIFSNFTR